VLWYAFIERRRGAECPPTSVDKFITPDSELWEMTYNASSGSESLASAAAVRQQRDAAAAAEAALMRRQLGVAAADGDAADVPLTASTVAYGETATAATGRRRVTRVIATDAQHYRDAVDEQVDFDDDDHRLSTRKTIRSSRYHDEL
jgi:hypothetical protein